MSDKFRRAGLVFVLCFALANSLNNEMRALLLSADRVEVGVETIYVTGNTIGSGVDTYRKTICEFPMERLRPWIEKSKLIPKKTNESWGFKTEPGLWFNFYKEKKLIAIFFLSYGSRPDTGINIDLQKPFSYELQPESAFAIRKIVALQPPFVKEMIKLGIKAQDLAPQRAYEIKN